MRIIEMRPESRKLFDQCEKIKRTWRPAPRKTIFRPEFTHAYSGETLAARDYGYAAFPLDVKGRRGVVRRKVCRLTPFDTGLSLQNGAKAGDTVRHREWGDLLVLCVETDKTLFLSQQFGPWDAPTATAHLHVSLIKPQNAPRM